MSAEQGRKKDPAVSAAAAEQQRQLAARCFQAAADAAEAVAAIASRSRPEEGADLQVIPPFVATTNENALQATAVGGTFQPISQIIESSKAFSKAFEDPKQTTKLLQEGRRGRPGNPQEGPRPTIIQTSGDADTRALDAPWGLVSTIVQAYNRHHELVLRPDDVWQAIVTQLSFYVNANAEALRDRFVDFKGKKTLVVYMGGTLWTADYATFARKMVDENIVANIKDPSVAAWLLPNFSTTTEADRVAASVSIMSILQAYFEFVCCLCCGIPKVTLLGTTADWRELRSKIDRLPDFDLKEGLMTRWHALLAPVLDQFVQAAQGSPDVTFWDRVCSHRGGGSGPSFLSGWVTVFSVFSHKGDWQDHASQVRGRGRGPSQTPNGESETCKEEQQWPVIDLDKLPVGAVSVPVLVDDNGVQYDTNMIAGQFAYEASGESGTAVRPRTDWCIAYTGERKADPRNYKHGEIRPSD